MEGGGGGRPSWSVRPEIPSRLHHFPPQKQKVVPRYCELVLPSQFCPCTFCARVLTILQSKSLRYHFERLCAGQKNLKLELRLFVSLPPGEAEI